MNLIGNNAVKLSDEQRIDADGEIYRATEWEYQGNRIEVNVSRYGYHARANRDGRTTKHSMDQGGLLSWLASLFGDR